MPQIDAFQPEKQGRMRDFLQFCLSYGIVRPLQCRRHGCPLLTTVEPEKPLEALPITDPTWIFFIVLSIILFAPMLLERLRVPSIVGMIFAGILIGPHGLHVLERDGSFELFGKVGLYYIMFLASLEMNLQDVQRIKGKALAFGLLGFVIPMTLGYAANSLILGCGIAASVLMAAMYASHTLIAYPIVLRYGLSRLTSVSIAVGGTIVADTLTLLVLAVVGGMFKDNVSGFYWVWLVVKVVGLGLLIIYAFPRLGSWFFRRYDESVVQYVFVLTLVFLGAGMMELVGMEGILGAFLVGIVLNRLIPPTSPLMSHIEFVGNALFIPYFLIGVGMIINVGALFSGKGGLIVALVMVIVGLLTKWLAAEATRRMFRMSGEDCRLMFGLTGSRAAATLAVVLVGYGIILPDGSHLLGEDVLNGAMILILVTCVVSSFVTESTARKMVLQRKASADMPAVPADAPDRLLLAINNPDTIVPLVNLTLMLRTPKSVVPPLALHVVLEGEPSALQAGHDQLQKVEKMAAAANVEIETFNRWSVNVVSGISHTVKENAISDLIIGLHQKQKLSESFYGKLGADLLGAVERQLLIYRPIIPLNTVRRLHLVVPGKAEFEPGFTQWMHRVGLLAQQISCSVEVYSTAPTLTSIERQWERQKQTVIALYHEYHSWNDLLPLAHNVRLEHMAIFVCARRGTISFHSYMDRLPNQVERCFSQRNLLFIYPSQPATESTAKAGLRTGLPINVK